MRHKAHSRGATGRAGEFTRRRRARRLNVARRASAPVAPRAGFTLVELLVVIAILGTLAAMLMPAVAGAYMTARITSVHSDLRQIDLAIHNYWLHYAAYPPPRTYCTAGKRHLYHCLPPELWECRFLDGPLEDPFNPGQTYRYAAVGPGYANDSPCQGLLVVPDTFPEPGGKVRVWREPHDSPVHWIAWSVGPNGPPADFVQTMQFNPLDPANWYPRAPRGIICRYHDGKASVAPGCVSR
jgi:prepilin-type N-terminal cleavage/methylation domain-containing protein